MLKLTLSLLLILFSCCIQAKETSLYQIDLIVFTHQQESNLASELSLHSTLSAKNNDAVSLETETNKNLTAYHLLPSSFSQLREEYWALHLTPQYHVLLHYTWLQPFSNRHAIILPKINREGWQLEGSLQVLRTNYYQLNTELLFSSADSNHPPFVFAQKQRLRGSNTYYFDHPRAGMLIKIHQLT